MRQTMSWVIALIVSGAPGSWADVAVTSRNTSSGWAGWGASESLQTEMIQGPRPRHEHKSKMTGSVLSHVTRDAATVQRSLLHKDGNATINVPHTHYPAP